MDVVELIRLEETEQGTLGVLKVNKEAFCCTLEPADRENAKNVSSIPTQQYVCEIHDSPKFGITYLVKDVPGRVGILFHSGNSADDTEGCILLGQHFGKLKGRRAVLNSGETFKRFLGAVGPRFSLTIREVY